MATFTQIQENLREAVDASAKARVAMILERVHAALTEAVTSSQPIDAMHAALDELKARMDEIAEAVQANLPEPEPTPAPPVEVPGEPIEAHPNPYPQPTPIEPPPIEPPVEPLDSGGGSPAPTPPDTSLPAVEPAPEPVPTPLPAEPVATQPMVEPQSSGFRGRRG